MRADMYLKGSEQRDFSDAHCYCAHRLRVQRLDCAWNTFTVTVTKFHTILAKTIMEIDRFCIS
jgi:hypothetical protein